MVLEFLLRHHARTGDADALEMVARHAARRWPAAASTTSSAAASPATPSTPAGWCRTSRRCCTTTLCCSGSTRTGGARPATRSPAGGAETADFLLRDLRTAEGGVRLRAGRRHRGRSRALTYVWTPAQLVEVLGPDDGAWAADAARGHRGRHLRARRVDAAAARRPRRPAAWHAGRRCARALLDGARRAAAAGPRRQGGRGLERAGGRRARRGRRAAGPARAGRRRRGGGDLLLAVHLGDEPDRLRPGLARRRRRARTPACSRTTATSPRASSPCYSVDRRVAEWLDARRGAARCRRSRASATARAASTTPPTTPRRWCAGRRTRTDNATPSGQAAAAGALLTYARPDRLRASTARRPRRRWASTRCSVAEHPRFAGWGAGRGRGAGRRPPRGGGRRLAADAGRCALRRAALRRRAPGPWSRSGTPDGRRRLPLLADRPLVDGRAGGLRLPWLRLRTARHRSRRPPALAVMR